MSGAPAKTSVTPLPDNAACMILACEAYLGDRNCSAHMRQYVYKRRDDGVHLIDIRKTWEKIVLAARVIATYPRPADVCVVASSAPGTTPIAQRAALKLGSHLGIHTIAGKFTPGTFTNHIQDHYCEPRLLIVANPYQDAQAIRESAYVNLPVIALCNTDNSLQYVDIAIPCNNRGRLAVAAILWLLAREVLYLRGTISARGRWTVIADMFVQPEHDEADKTEAKGGHVATVAVAPATAVVSATAATPLPAVVGAAAVA